MGEIFERPKPGAALEWTGERLTSAVSGQIEIEHLHRYFLARELCRGLDVLDVASGEGYGTALLAQTAKSAVGVELAAAAARHAAANYRLPNLRYLEGDARQLPLPDGCVDAVVSFETIEHFYEQDTFLAEVKRVLRPGGRLIVSSPDRDVYSPPGQPANPYHARELARDEFEALLGQYFAHVAIFGQRPMLGSALLPWRGAGEAPLTFERRGDGWFETSAGLPRSIYLVAIASDRAVAAPPSVYIERTDIGDVLNRAAVEAVVRAELIAVQARLQAAEVAAAASRAEAEGAGQRLLVLEQGAAEQARTLEARLEAAQQEGERGRLAAGQAESAAHAAARAELKAAREEAASACAQRDLARLGLRRAGVFAENRWRNRVDELEAEVRALQEAQRERERQQREAAQENEDWRARYHMLRGRLDVLLRRTGVLPASRMVPRPVRQWALEVIRRRTKT